MKTNRLVLALGLCSALSLMGMSSANAAQKATKNVAVSRTRSGIYRPAPGSTEYKAILHSFRAAWLKGSEHKNVVFPVDRLSVKGRWACIFCIPQAPNGGNHYGFDGAPMRRQNGKWKVLQLIRGENACALPCLKRKFPQMPTEIYPQA